MEQKQYAWVKTGLYETWSDCRFNSFDECYRNAIITGFEPGTRPLRPYIREDVEPNLDVIWFILLPAKEGYEEE